MKKEFVPGQLVKSVAGRDSNMYFLVMETGDEVVGVADGNKRKVEKPKKKNVKHVKKYDIVAEDIAQRLNSGMDVKNEDVSKAIGELTVDLEG